MTFQNKYDEIKKIIQPELAQVEEQLTYGIFVREPLNSDIKNFLHLPSKRIRSVLSILYSKALNYDLTDKQIEFLTVIELIHNASLIHDDVIDECETRRGQKTIGAEFNNKLAVISGDYILSVAIEKLANLDNIQLISKVIQTVKKMCIGEINQNFDRFKVGTIEQYIDKTKNKTAYLFEMALIGTMLLCKTDIDLKKVSNFGLNVGIAFQIRDDILNFTDKENEKPVKNDVSEGIYNAPVILGTKDDNYLSGIEKTKLLLDNYVDKAKLSINVLPKNEYSIAIENFLELLRNV